MGCRLRRYCDALGLRRTENSSGQRLSQYNRRESKSCEVAAAKDDPMRTELFWIEGPWRGRLAIMPRPRGGDWLEDEIQAWRRSGVDVVVSLLTREEQAELNLLDEESLCRANGTEFDSFPIFDRSVPASMGAFSEKVLKLADQLARGRNIAVHCRQGIGRAAVFAICLLVLSGMESTASIEEVRAARGCVVPETPEQRGWISDFAQLVVTKPFK